jgi:hypothetical protein
VRHFSQSRRRESLWRVILSHAVTEVDMCSRGLTSCFSVGGVAGEAIAAGLRDSGLTLAVVERELVGAGAHTGAVLGVGLRAFGTMSLLSSQSESAYAHEC